MLRIDPKFVAAAKSAKTASDLHELLQMAVQLEHSTIPPYLTAVHSLKLGTNAAIRRIIGGVAREEMLHLAIVANILNAIDGRPRIDDPQFIPSYPGPLPMNIGDGLQVGLKKFSKELVRDVFMEIETPENPIHFKSILVDQFATIGQFYRAIMAKIAELGDALFTGDPARQVVAGAGFQPHQLFAITNAETALRALERVIDDGEGTTTLPFDVDGRLAHYYLFEQIVRGHQLVQNAAAPNGFSYTGAVIPFEPDGVWDIPDNPKAADYPVGSAARNKVDGFNRAYSDLLRLLDDTFNGSPGSIGSALFAMRALQSLADDVVATQDPVSLRQLGVPFEYVPAV